MSNEDIKYIVSEASLKNIADAIRGNLSANLSLIFPAQFQDVINNMKPASDSFQKFCESGTDFGENVSLKIPDIVSHIGENAFKDCLGISEVLFSDNSICTEIGDYSFYGCMNLTKVTLPSCIQKLGNSCFITNGYHKPITVQVKNTTPPTWDDSSEPPFGAFLYDGSAIYVPSLEIYTKSKWSIYEPYLKEQPDEQTINKEDLGGQLF